MERERCWDCEASQAQGHWKGAACDETIQNTENLCQPLGSESFFPNLLISLLGFLCFGYVFVVVFTLFRFCVCGCICSKQLFDKIFCAVLPTMSIQEHAGNEKSCVWHAADFADGELKEETFCIRFASIESEYFVYASFGLYCCPFI